MSIFINILAIIGLVTVIVVAGAIALLVRYDPTKDPENQYYRRPVNVEAGK